MIHHADWFSGIGGFALGMEAAGFTTVSFSEIDPFPSQILAQHWPGVPNLGDITKLSLDDEGGEAGRGKGSIDKGRAVLDPLHWEQSDIVRAGRIQPSGVRRRTSSDVRNEATPQSPDIGDWQDARVWTGGFPCQDLSQAGLRRGLVHDGQETRSGLAFAFLRLAERCRPEWIILENVTGLLTSNQGRDLAALLDKVEELGYGWAFRTLDAQHFGVPQRRRRVFIVAALGHSGAERAAKVLALSESGERDTGTCWQEGEEAAREAAGGVGVGYSGPLTNRYHKGINTTIDDGAVVVHREALDSNGVREAAGVPGRVHKIDAIGDEPLGQDSKRYKALGNAVCVPVVEWIADRLMMVMTG